MRAQDATIAMNECEIGAIDLTLICLVTQLMNRLDDMKRTSCRTRVPITH